MPKKKSTKSVIKPRAPQTPKTSEGIVIDEAKNLVFKNEEELKKYFAKAIETIEGEYLSLLDKGDINDDEQIERSSFLESTLDEPDYIWSDSETVKNMTIHHLIKGFDDHGGFFYIAIVYLSAEAVPTFVFTHFATRDEELVKNYERGELVFDRKYEEIKDGGIEGDSLIEGDSFAMGMYSSMMTIRSEKDIQQQDFSNFKSLREETIEAADEIWRKSDLDGNVLVTFIKEFPDHEVKELHYVAVTLEEPSSQVHALLFSFPTNDQSLVDRYRQGENLQAEEVSQESSH